MNGEECKSLADAVYPVILEAREAVLKVYRSGRFDTEEKSDHSPVTAADRASHKVLSEGLSRLFPEVPVVSEEAHEEPLPLGDGARYWLVDPLDGTKEFIRQTGEFTINVGLVDRSGRPIWGLVDVPLSGRTYVGGGGGAFSRDASGDMPLEPLKPATAGQGAVVALSRSHQGAADDWLRAHHIAVKRLVYAGSAVKFCWAAEGRVDLYVRLRPTMGWDTAAGQAILESVGGSVHTMEGVPLRYEPAARVNPFFVAGRPGF